MPRMSRLEYSYAIYIVARGDGRRRLFHCRYLAIYLCRRYRGATLRELSIEIGLFHPDRGLLGGDS